MTSQLSQAFLPMAIVAFLFVCLNYYFTAWSLIRYLKSNHRSVWKSLGEPEAIDSLMSRRIDLFTDSGVKGPKFNTWVFAGGHLSLGDALVSRLARRLKLLRLLTFASILMLVGGYELQRRR